MVIYVCVLQYYMWVDRHIAKVKAAAEVAAREAAELAFQQANIGPGMLARGKSTRSLAGGLGSPDGNAAALVRAKSEKAFATSSKMPAAGTSTKLPPYVANTTQPAAPAGTAAKSGKVVSIVTDGNKDSRSSSRPTSRPESRAATAQDIAAMEAQDADPASIQARNRQALQKVPKKAVIDVIEETVQHSQSMVQSFGLDPHVIPRGPRQKVQLAEMTPWHPTSPASRKLDPIVFPNAPGRSTSPDSQSKNTRSSKQGSDKDDTLDEENLANSNSPKSPSLNVPAHVTGTQRTAATLAHRRMTAAAIFDTVKIGRRPTEAAEKAALLLVRFPLFASLFCTFTFLCMRRQDKFVRLAAPNTRRLIQTSTVAVSLEQRVEEQLEIVLKVSFVTFSSYSIGTK
jgi:hypothetical protein